MNTLPYRVSSAYEELFHQFRRVAEDANQTVSFPETPVPGCFRPAARDTTVTFETCLYLKNWPSNKLRRGKQLHVLVKVLEALKRLGPLPRGRWSLTRSTVYLNYIIVSGRTARLAQSLHFDFVEGGQDDHPIFHLQLTAEQIPANDLRTAGFDLELELPDQANECGVTTRIPTPDMTLASVLYCIVADHLGTHFFKDFAEHVRPIEGRLPHPTAEALRKSLQKPSTHFKSSHWFAHMHERTL
jgi:hypothetical protein